MLVLAGITQTSSGVEERGERRERRQERGVSLSYEKEKLPKEKRDGLAEFGGDR